MPLKEKKDKTLIEWIKYLIFCALTLGVYDISEESLKKRRKGDQNTCRVGIPVACFLHGYAGFIFGSVKANALWMTPLMPVIFIMSAIVSGIALCLLTYIVTMELRKCFASRNKAPYAMHASVEGGDKERRNACHKNDGKIPAVLHGFCHKP